MALPYATENQLKQVTKSEVTKAINPILATGSIRKKPYVEKVVESLSDTSLELLRETLNTNKDNVNVSLVGGSNLLKKFKKEYVGNLLTESTQVSSIYFNFGKYNTWEKVEKLSSSLLWIDFVAFITSDVAEENEAAVVMIKGNTDLGAFNKIRLLEIVPSTGSDFDLQQSLFSGAFLGDEQEAQALAQAIGITGFEWQGEGWYTKELKKIEDDIFVLDDMQVQIIGQVTKKDIETVKSFISFNKPFTPSNTQLTGHIPAVGDKIEKVYFNPNAYSTDEEWKLWYESLKQAKDGSGDLIGAFSCLWKWVSNNDVNVDFVLDKYVLSGVGTLTDILVLSVLNNALVYVTNKALTGSQSAVYQQFGVTETGWYKADMSAMTFTKITDIVELTGSAGNVVIVREDEYDDKIVYEVNDHLFAKVLSYNETFTETPIQNLLKPNPIQVGQEVSKIYINLGYFDNDLNKMKQYIGEGKVLFKLDDGNELQIGFGDTAIIKFLQSDKQLLYLSQKTVSNASIGTQDDVNKWALVHTENNETIIDEIIDTDVFELPLEGTITELGDTSLISFNKPFEVEGGWIYEDVTPVTLELEKDLNQDGILIWDDTQCVLLAYYPYKNLIDIFVIDPENYNYEKLFESATIEELRRVVFTPTQESTVEETTSLELEWWNLNFKDELIQYNISFRLTKESTDDGLKFLSSTFGQDITRDNIDSAVIPILNQLKSSDAAKIGQLLSYTLSESLNTIYSDADGVGNSVYIGALGSIGLGNQVISFRDMDFKSITITKILNG